MKKRVGRLWKDRRGKTEVLWDKPPQYQFVNHKSHVDCTEIETGPTRWEAGGTNGLWSLELNEMIYICAPVPTGNTFQDLPRLRETADNTERYI
jgi:hypothetical protein